MKQGYRNLASLMLILLLCALASAQITVGKRTVSPQQPPNKIPCGPVHRDSSNFTIQRLTGVKVYPDIGAVGFRFTARPDAAPVVEIDKEPPVIGRDGLPVFRNPLRMKAARDNRNSSAVTNIYIGSSAAQGIKLEQGKLYHFIIRVSGDGSIPTHYATGSFTTLGRTVKVRWATLNFIDNGHQSDDLLAGFSLTINRDEPTEESDSFTLRNVLGLKRVNSELFIRNAPDRLTISAKGDVYRNPNSVSRTFDLTEYQFVRPNASVPFVLQTRLVKGAVFFEVTGSIEIVGP